MCIRDRNPSTLKEFHDDFTTGEPYVMMPGTDYAHLMIPVQGYYKYQPESKPKK